MPLGSTTGTFQAFAEKTGMTETYSIWRYGEMISDATRMAAYEAALKRSVSEASVVLDIGTGTGIFALLACRFGAAKVYAIEPSAAIQVAREIAAANHYSDRIVFIPAVSTDVDLPEQADVIVSDLRSVLPLYEHHFVAIADARRRFLAPGGRLIPQQDELWAALVRTPELYRKIVDPYLDNPYQLDMRAPLRFITNELRKGSRLTPADLFMEPQRWNTLDYRHLEGTDVHGDLNWIAAAPATVYGFCVWFDTVLAEGIGFSNAPGAPDLIYGRAFFPWTEPVDLDLGDQIQVSLKATLAGGAYLWSWRTRVENETCVKATFNQSTFQQSPQPLSELRKRTDAFVPKLNETAQLHRYILDHMDKGISLRQIAQQVTDRFPDRFANWQDALHEVAELSQKYSC